MGENKEVYQTKLTQLQAKSNANLQKFIDSAFFMVAEARDIEERKNEIQELLKGEPKK
jgi:hypothetical protein